MPFFTFHNVLTCGRPGPAGSLGCALSRAFGAMHKPKLVGQLASALDHLPCLCEVIEIPRCPFCPLPVVEVTYLACCCSCYLDCLCFLFGGRTCVHVCAASERLVGLGMNVPVTVHGATFAFLLKQTVCPLGRCYCWLPTRQRIAKGC